MYLSPLVSRNELPVECDCSREINAVVNRLGELQRKSKRFGQKALRWQQFQSDRTNTALGAHRICAREQFLARFRQQHVAAFNQYKIGCRGILLSPQSKRKLAVVFINEPLDDYAGINDDGHAMTRWLASAAHHARDA